MSKSDIPIYGVDYSRNKEELLRWKLIWLVVQGTARRVVCLEGNGKGESSKEIKEMRSNN